jgi:hypothetical protein
MSEQTHLDHLVPHHRAKFRLEEVAAILGPDGHPLSTRAIREATESGQLGGNRLPLSAAPGREQRIKIEWVTADDLLLYLLRTRTLEPRDHLDRLLRLLDHLPAPATALRAQRAQRTLPFTS